LVDRLAGRRLEIHVDEGNASNDVYSKLNIKSNNFKFSQQYRQPKHCGTAFVKYRNQLSPKYMQAYKKNQKKLDQIDQNLSYKAQRTDGAFEARVAGVNCEIPNADMSQRYFYQHASWNANKLRSTNSSAFVLSTKKPKCKLS